MDRVLRKNFGVDLIHSISLDFSPVGQRASFTSMKLISHAFSSLPPTNNTVFSFLSRVWMSGYGLWVATARVLIPAEGIEFIYYVLYI